MIKKNQMQKMQFALLRNDVMLAANSAPTGKPYVGFKQVEINTIASGFGHLGPISRALHRCTNYKHTHTSK